MPHFTQHLFLLVALVITGLLGTLPKQLALQKPTIDHRLTGLRIARLNPTDLLAYLQGLRDDGFDVSPLLHEFEHFDPILAQLEPLDLIRKCLEMLEANPPTNPFQNLYDEFARSPRASSKPEPCLIFVTSRDAAGVS